MAADTPDLWHLTLTTGHGRRSPRSEVEADTIDALRPIVALAGGVVHGLHIEIIRRTLLDGRTLGAAYTIGLDGRSPAVRCVLCCDRSAHETSWRDALDHFAENPIQTASAALIEPSVPWLTVEMLPGAIGCQIDDIQLIADAERCVAWTMMEPR